MEPVPGHQINSGTYSNRIIVTRIPAHPAGTMKWEVERVHPPTLIRVGTLRDCHQKLFACHPRGGVQAGHEESLAIRIVYDTHIPHVPICTVVWNPVGSKECLPV